METRGVWACLAGLLALAACDKKAAKQPAPHYKTMRVELCDRALQTEYSATLSGCETVEVRPQVSGLITKILIREGQTVRRGQPLFVIDQVPYQAAESTARASLAAARAAEGAARLAYDSRLALRDQQVVSDFDLQTARQQLMEARAKTAEAEAQLRNARNSLSYTTVRSPLNGVAGMIPYHVGALVSSSVAEPLVTVSDDSRMRAYFSISERECTDLMMRYGSMDSFAVSVPDIRLRLSNGADYAGRGRLDAASGIVDTGTGSVTLRAQFPNPSHLLRHGGSATVILQTPREGVVVIPRSATFELQNKVFAYRVERGKATSVALEVDALPGGRECVVESGLTPGDVIIAEGAGLVREGEAVR